MKYALLIHLPAGVDEQLSTADEQSINETCDKLTRDVRRAGHYGGSVRLAPARTAVSLRMRGREQIVTDGPFTETKEYLAGFYLLDCESLDEAIAYAGRHPGAPLGRIEIRPVHSQDPV